MRSAFAVATFFLGALLSACTLPDERRSQLAIDAPSAPIGVGLAMDFTVWYDTFSGALCGAKSSASSLRPQGGTLPDPCALKRESVEILDRSCGDTCSFDDARPSQIRLRPTRSGNVPLHVRARRADGSVHEIDATLRAETFDHFALTTPACSDGTTSLCDVDLQNVKVAVGLRVVGRMGVVSTEGHELANTPEISLGPGLVDTTFATNRKMVDALVGGTGTLNVFVTLETFSKAFVLNGVVLDPSSPLELHSVKNGILDEAIVHDVVVPRASSSGSTGRQRYVLTTPALADGARALVGAENLGSFTRLVESGFVDYDLEVAASHPWVVFGPAFDVCPYELEARGKSVARVTCTER